MASWGGVKIGIAGLALGALLVGVAIVMDSDVGRAVNGVGGVLWFASTVLLTLAAWRTRPPVWLWAVLALVVIAVAFVVKPSAIVPAMIGFVPAGLLLGAIAPKSNIISLKALDFEGKGKISDIIAALDWAIANKAQYNIRVINVSVAAGVFEAL